MTRILLLACAVLCVAGTAVAVPPASPSVHRPLKKGSIGPHVGKIGGPAVAKNHIGGPVPR